MPTVSPVHMIEPVMEENYPTVLPDKLAPGSLSIRRCRRSVAIIPLAYAGHIVEGTCRSVNCNGEARFPHYGGEILLGCVT